MGNVCKFKLKNSAFINFEKIKTYQLKKIFSLQTLAAGQSLEFP
jgi:hypothetical protein